MKKAFVCFSVLAFLTPVFLGCSESGNNIVNASARNVLPDFDGLVVEIDPNAQPVLFLEPDKAGQIMAAFRFGLKSNGAGISKAGIAIEQITLQDVTSNDSDIAAFNLYYSDGDRNIILLPLLKQSASLGFTVKTRIPVLADSFNVLAVAVKTNKTANGFAAGRDHRIALFKKTLKAYWMPANIALADSEIMFQGGGNFVEGETVATVLSLSR